MGQNRRRNFEIKLSVHQLLDLVKADALPPYIRDEQLEFLAMEFSCMAMELDKLKEDKQ